MPEIPDFIGFRKLYFGCKVDSDDEDYDEGDRELTEDYEHANLISSEGPGGFHYPVIDLDFPARLEPSTTPGHFHLYLDRAMTWPQYRKLLRALHQARIIEKGFCALSIKRGASFVRKPGHKKIIAKKPVQMPVQEGDISEFFKG